MVVKLAVFASGRGTNFSAIQQAIQAEKMPAEIVRVISDKADAGVLELASQFGIPVTVVDYKQYPDRISVERDIIDVLRLSGVDGILLAGYMRILTPVLLSAYPNKIINIHPALLPSFPGNHGIEDAYNYGVKVTGVTVHFVDAGMDTGKIIAQQPVIIEQGDTLAVVETKIHAAEHILYPKTLKTLLEKGVFN
ncbi:MAG TPA: phosphoribosylglycinamide formyltransferase [Lactobacillaceae bacterium]|jgi:phosphoribosylglycinamide formyltransferase-1